MKKNTTNLKRVETINFLKSHYPIGKEFTLNDLMFEFPNSPAHMITITYLVKLGYISKLKRGVYYLNPSINDADIIEKIVILCNKASADNYKAKKDNEQAKRDELQKTLISTAIEPKLKQITTITQYSDLHLINELKSRGYKIMKPINQYEEV